MIPPVRIDPMAHLKDKVVVIADGSNCKIEDFQYQSIDISYYRKSFISEEPADIYNR